ncbi:uncharacterized protein LOC124642704 [Helicoverpa zea]|uniref:uncharacterized protein LOC124642704 n=1 Tax=Helicoverpa zea TaxID=7113 RepID=UPI001F58A288|nr:uncharacterized protein LOC124642704 [Helicoverpa zea]
MAATKVKAKPSEEEVVVFPEENSDVPPYGTLEWLHYWSSVEGHLPTPIDVSITGSTNYNCPDLRWINFNVYPNKVKLTNTGYTLVLSSKWKAERPYIEGGPFLEKHILSQIHFHWGDDMMKGSDHMVDKRRYPAEMQVSFFRAEYMTQEEALKHPDGVTMICYMIKYGVNPDDRLNWIIEGFPRVREAKSHTKIGPCPMSKLLPIFYEDYFLYWGELPTARGDSFTIKWLIPRPTLFASLEQLDEFRKLWDPWDEPNQGNFRPLQDRHNRHVFFINPHWAKYNSLLPIPRVDEPGVTTLSQAYQKYPWMLPPQNHDEMARLMMRHVQSPISISKVMCPQFSLQPLNFKRYWDNEHGATLFNTGRTAKFMFESEKNRPILSGGPLNGEYIFEQMHFSWSFDNATGCEHVVDDHGYAAESQLIHYNSKYGNFEEALGYTDGLAIVGFFLQATEDTNPQFEKLAEGLDRIKRAEQTTRVTAEALSWMDREDLQKGPYFTYKGSLTITPYVECVDWILFEKPVAIGFDQIACLRRLQNFDCQPIEHNVRAIHVHPGYSAIFVKQVKCTH